METDQQARVSFPAHIDSHELPGLGTVYHVELPAECRRTDLGKLVGQVVSLGGLAFRVRGVESRCVDHQHKGWPIGLLGEFV